MHYAKVEFISTMQIWHTVNMVHSTNNSIFKMLISVDPENIFYAI